MEQDFQKMKIVSASKDAHKIFTDAEIITIDISSFPDSETNFAETNFAETNLKFDLIDDDEVLIYWPLERGCINSQIFNLLLVINSLRDINVSVFLPYLPYCRQDKSSIGFLPLGLSFIEILKKCGVSKIFSVQIHNPKFFPDVIDIDCSEFWANHLRGQDIVLASPDFGGIERVNKIAKLLNVPAVYIEKERSDTGKTRSVKLHGDVKGRKVVLIDDILDTANTAVNACNMLLDNGALEVTGCFVHGIFSLNADKLISESKFKKVYVTDTFSPIRIDKVEVLDFKSLELQTREFMTLEFFIRDACEYSCNSRSR